MFLYSIKLPCILYVLKNVTAEIHAFTSVYILCNRFIVMFKKMDHKIYLLNHHELYFHWCLFYWCSGGGGTQLFSGRGVRPGFPKCGACELILASEKGGGLWTENFPIWGLVNWKFPNLGACELKISKFEGLWAEIWAKIEAVEAKISKFSQKGVLWTDPFAWNGTFANCRRGVKRGSSEPHIPIPPF